MPQVCLDCRKSFKRKIPVQVCPECKNEVYSLHSNFKPPKSTDTKGWELVRFLIFKGFDFSGWVQRADGKEPWAASRPGYPKTMNEAEDFVKKWQPVRIPK